MANETRSPLITKWTNNISNREKDTGLSAYAVGKVFAGSSLPDTTNLDNYSTVGIFRITNNILGTKPTISDTTGFLQVMDINHDEESNSVVKNTRRIRQIIYPDKADESSPYTRVGEASSLTANINWSEWAMMGGGSLRRVVATSDINNALNNVMYEVFTSGLTITLPSATSVPVGTQIGIEQYVGTGTVRCGDLEQVTESDIAYYEPSEVTHPVMVSRWSHNPGTPSVIYNQIVEIQGGAGIDGTNTFSVTGTGDIDGNYTPLNTSATGQNRVWQNGYVRCEYDTTEQVWQFVNYSNSNDPYVMYKAEYSFKSADALCYVFECVIGDDGEREWILDVDNNFAKAVDILSNRITGVEDKIDEINDREPYLHLLRTRTTKTLVNPSTSQLVCVKPATNATVDEQIAILRNNDSNVYFYDFVVSVTDTRTINLPTSDVPLGASICIEVVGACSVTVVAGSDSDTFTGAAGEILVCDFEYTKVGANSNKWTVLALA